MSDDSADGDLDALLTYLRDQRGFDFTGYKRPSLSRRITKRMQAVGANSYRTYLELLEANPGEFVDLFDTILINVTGFLRDRDAWNYLADEILPVIVQGRDPSQPIRLWSAGCASGEEAYSLAVLMAEAVGEEHFRRSVKIYATDADESALTDARHARYRVRDLLEAFGEERTARFFEVDNGYGVFRQDLRPSLIFGRHDLIQDPPISRIDLLTCRNTLMYFTAEAQRRALTAFHFALATGGYLFLGKSEALVTRTNLFQVVDLRHHVFRKDGKAEQERLSYSTAALPRPPATTPREGTRLYIESVFESSPTAQLVVDRLGLLVLANRHARNVFGLGVSEIGRPFRELEISYRPADLRTPIDQVLRERHPLVLPEVAWQPPAGDIQHLEIALMPIGDGTAASGVAVTFTDTGRYKRLEEQLIRSRSELEAAYEELQSAVEELETTNEELQSTNEELETTNEELQSTNEELETMNEELQSTNEELETTNEELHSTNEELETMNEELQSILGSLHSGVAVISRELQVRAWNRQAEDLWGLRAEEVEGHHFLNLDIGLPVDQLRPAIRAVLSNGSEHRSAVLKAINRRGRTIDCTVSVHPLLAEGQVAGAIVLMDVANSEPPAHHDGANSTERAD